MIGMILCGALFISAILSHHSGCSDICVMGQLIASALFYIGMHVSALGSREEAKDDMETFNNGYAKGVDDLVKALCHMWKSKGGSDE